MTLMKVCIGVDLLSFFAEINTLPFIVNMTKFHNLISIYLLAYLQHCSTTKQLIIIYDFKRPHLIIKIATLTSSVIGEYEKNFFEIFFERYFSVSIYI